MESGPSKPVMIISHENARELQRIVRETTGREISLREAYNIWHFLISLLRLMWRIEGHPLGPRQLKLF